MTARSEEPEPASNHEDDEKMKEEGFETVENLTSDVPASSEHDSKGKSKQKVHQRTPSEESLDPLQWSPGRLKAEGLIFDMENLNIAKGVPALAALAGNKGKEQSKEEEEEERSESVRLASCCTEYKGV
ncbi:hypothetical protein E4U55_007158 [Claviceps digitariae]|nr:hypothetical protein E4U55_007158 [Claviceps digitariae]